MTVHMEKKTVWLTSKGTECEDESEALKTELEEVTEDLFQRSYSGDGEYSFEEWWSQFKGLLCRSDDFLVSIGRAYSAFTGRSVKITTGAEWPDRRVVKTKAGPVRGDDPVWGDNF